MTYGLTTGVSENRSNSDEYLFVQGTDGDIVKHFKKYKRVEVVTETLPDSFQHPVMSPTSAGGYRKELRCSNTDFARLSTTAVTFSTIA